MHRTLPAGRPRTHLSEFDQLNLLPLRARLQRRQLHVHVPCTQGRHLPLRGSGLALRRRQRHLHVKMALLHVRQALLHRRQLLLHQLARGRLALGAQALAAQHLLARRPGVLQVALRGRQLPAQLLLLALRAAGRAARLADRGHQLSLQGGCLGLSRLLPCLRAGQLRRQARPGCHSVFQLLLTLPGRCFEACHLCRVQLLPLGQVLLQGSKLAALGCELLLMLGCRSS
jgi:hypothetical protein